MDTWRGVSISPARGRSRAGWASKVVSWYTSWPFSWTFLGLEVRVHRGEWRTDPLRVLAESLCAGPHRASLLLLHPGFLLPGVFLNTLGLSAGCYTAVGRVGAWRGSAQSGSQLILSLGTLAVTQPECDLQMSMNIAGGGGGPKDGSVGALLCPQVPRAHAGFSRR